MSDYEYRGVSTSVFLCHLESYSHRSIHDNCWMLSVIVASIVNWQSNSPRAQSYVGAVHFLTHVCMIAEVEYNCLMKTSTYIRLLILLSMNVRFGRDQISPVPKM